MVMTTLEKTRKTLISLIKEYQKDEESNPVKFRNTVHAFSILLQYWKLEKEVDMEKRIEEIERILGES